jgi:hypothetical protein
VSRSPNSKLNVGVLEVFAFRFRLDADDNGLVDQRAISRVVEGQLAAIWLSSCARKGVAKVPNRPEDNGPVHHFTPDAFIIRVKRVKRGGSHGRMHATCASQQKQEWNSKSNRKKKIKRSKIRTHMFLTDTLLERDDRLRARAKRGPWTSELYAASESPSLRSSRAWSTMRSISASVGDVPRRERESNGV